MNDDERNAFEQLVDVVVQTQGTNLAVYHILMELVVRVAESQPDPSSFAKSMYEAISAKLDLFPLEMEKKRVSADQRLTLSTFFSVVERAVRRRHQRKTDSNLREP